MGDTAKAKGEKIFKPMGGPRREWIIVLPMNMNIDTKRHIHVYR